WALASLLVVAVLGLATSTLLASPELQGSGQPAGPTATPTPTQTGPSAQALSGPQSITVSGDGEARGGPDIAQVVIGVTELAPTSGEALASANSAMNGAINAARSRGVDDSDIQTSGLVLQP